MIVNPLFLRHLIPCIANDDQVGGAAFVKQIFKMAAAVVDGLGILDRHLLPQTDAFVGEHKGKRGGGNRSAKEPAHGPAPTAPDPQMPESLYQDHQ